MHAALSVLKAVERYKNACWQMHMGAVGIATGLVVVGDLIGKGAVHEKR